MTPDQAVTESPKTSASLILRLRSAADAEAWQEFSEIYQPLVFRIARSRGLQEADSHDLTQEVLTRVARAIDRFDPNPKLGTFRGWISRVTRNLVVEFLRNKNRLPKTSDNTAVFEIIKQTPDPSSESQLFDIEHERQVFAWAAEKVKDSFSDKTWLAFWQTAVDSRPVTETANDLGLSCGAVYIARSRVMARLKETIERSQFDSRY